MRSERTVRVRMPEWQLMYLICYLECEAFKVDVRKDYFLSSDLGAIIARLQAARSASDRGIARYVSDDETDAPGPS